MTDELIKEIYDLMLKSEGDSEELGFEIKLRFENNFDGEKLELLNETLMKYKDKSENELVIDKFLMHLFYEFVSSCQATLGYDKYGTNSEYQMDVMEAVMSTADIVNAIVTVDGNESSDLAQKLGDLLLNDEDGYLVKLSEGQELDEDQMDEISNVLEEYCSAYADSQYIEKYFMYVFLNFVTCSYESMRLYAEEEQIMIEDFVEEISSKIWGLTDVES